MFSMLVNLFPGLNTSKYPVQRRLAGEAIIPMLGLSFSSLCGRNKNLYNTTGQTHRYIDKPNSQRIWKKNTGIKLPKLLKQVTLITIPISAMNHEA
ncbi:hypothetical protein [Mycoplasmopsis anatis]|uniref:hypothetical protein n=1 Tax=Mycoplasmopsis anatis TaxID=171279 RepID=UPI003F865F72